MTRKREKLRARRDPVEMEEEDEGELESPDEAEEGEEDGEEEGDASQKEVYLPSMGLQEGETLEMDESAYLLYHQAQTGSPCLSFDVLPDSAASQAYPYSCFLVTGTQAAQVHLNKLMVLKMGNLTKNMHGDKPAEDDEDDGSDSEDEGPSGDAKLTACMWPHLGTVNRVRFAATQTRPLAASWSDQGKVYVWDLAAPLVALSEGVQNLDSHKPLFTFSGHQSEGYGMAWNPSTLGQLLTGDCDSKIHLWNPTETSWNVDVRSFQAHTASVEDIQWSPSEASVFSSCSADGSVRVWDIRAAPSAGSQLAQEKAHESDVNVISWSASEPFLLSGGDDGAVKCWDLRQFGKNSAPAVHLKQHTAPITSVEWYSRDASVFAASSADNSITLWDLAVEADATSGEQIDVPPQLLFIHQGLSDPKELHWVPEQPGLIAATGENGFDLFRTISI